MKTLPITSKLLKTLALAALFAPFACAAAEVGAEAAGAGTSASVRQDETGTGQPAGKKAKQVKKQPKKPVVTVTVTGRNEPDEKGTAPEPDPGWIGDCYYYADGGYYHKDGVYWRADLKTHYVYEEECWHLANGGILTGTGVYFPPVVAPDGALGIPWRLAAVTAALIAGPPEDPGKPPAKPPVRVIIEARPSSGR